LNLRPIAYEAIALPLSYAGICQQTMLFIVTKGRNFVKKSDDYYPKKTKNMLGVRIELTTPGFSDLCSTD
jgi:hypothetical protein